MILARKCSGIAQSFFRASVDRVWSDGGVDKRIPLPLLQEFFAVGAHLRFGLVVWGREIDPRFAKYAAKAGGFGFFGLGIFEVIHVREGSGAAANHFRER